MAETPPFKEGYARGANGIRLYYRVEGEEGLPLVCANGIGVSTFFWEPLAQELGRHHRVVRFDYRAHGRSDSPRDPSDISIATCVEDQLAVMDALGIERALLLGHSMGAQVDFEFYRAHPDRTLGLVPTLGPYRRAIETFMDTSLSLSAFAAMKAVVGTAPALISRTIRPILLSGVAELAARKLGIVDAALAPKRLMLQYMEHMTRLDLRSYLVLAEDIQRQDATDLLPNIGVPVLVVAGEKDIFCPLRLAYEMVAQIPGAELLIIPNGTHAALIEQPQLLCLRVQKFIEERLQPGAPKGRTRKPRAQEVRD